MRLNKVRLHGFTSHASSVSSTVAVPTRKHRECRFRLLRPLAEKRGLEPLGKIVMFNIDTQCQSIVLNTYYGSMGGGNRSRIQIERPKFYS